MFGGKVCPDVLIACTNATCMNVLFHSKTKKLKIESSYPLTPCVLFAKSAIVSFCFVFSCTREPGFEMQTKLSPQQVIEQ